MIFAEKAKLRDIASLVLKVILVIAGLSALAWLGMQNYLLFHCLTELFSITVAAAIFIVAWNVRDTIENGYLLFLGIALLFIAAVDLVHTLAYDGMGVFPGHNANLPTQLWIAARGLEAATLLCAPIFLLRRVRPAIVFASYAVFLVCLLLSIFSWRIFPPCYIPGYGLTSFKITAEYLISLILVLAMAELLLFRQSFPRPILWYLCFSMTATILSELTFTQYMNVYGNLNALGHMLKVISVGFFYKAIVETGFRRPYELVYRSLWESEHQFRIMGETVPYGVWLCNPDGGMRYCSQSFLDLLNMTHDEFRQFGWTRRLLPEDAEFVIQKWLHCCATGQLWDHELRISDRHCAIQTILSRGLPVRDGEGRITCWVGVNLDITQRKKDEELIQDAKERAEVMAEALMKSNRELEQFGYIISHDLQEPLRTISGFLSLIRVRQSSLSEEKFHQYIDFAMDAASRMSQMIKDLLEYSRVGRQNRPPEVVDTAEVFKEARDNCIASIHEAEAVVTCGELPDVIGDRQHLVQLFQNLIGNAVKFRRAEVRPEIHLSAMRENGCWIFRIRDNGIGIEKDQIARLFVLFRRLHGRDSYGGTGIGLALCRKIVELHGGRIWIESEAGVGTEVFFSLSAVPYSNQSNNELRWQTMQSTMSIEPPR